MERTLDDVRRPLRLRKIFGGLALASILVCVVVYVVARTLGGTGETLPWGVMAAVRSTLAAVVIFFGGHALLALLAAYVVNWVIRREEEGWAQAHGAQLVLVWKPALLLPWRWSAPWWWDDEGLTTVGRERHAWRDLQRVTLTQRRSTVVLNVLFDYRVVRMWLEFASGSAFAALDTSRFGGAQDRRRRAFSESVTARVSSVQPIVTDTRGLQWVASETRWDGTRAALAG